MKHLLRFLWLFTALLGREYSKAQCVMHDTATATCYDTTVTVSRNQVTTAALKQQQMEVVVYPNPATGEVNVLYDAKADIKSIAVYNLIGKLMTVYKTADNGSANLNLENIPEGIYYVWLINSQGDVMATKKFTKQ
jgi:hypothetical protein